MTIEKLLSCKPEELEAFTDAQLLEFFAPVLKFVRPPEKDNGSGSSEAIDMEAYAAELKENKKTDRAMKRKTTRDLDKMQAELELLAKKKGLV